MIVPTTELMQSSESLAGGVVPFGHTQVADAVRLVAAMVPQELRQFAEQLNCANADNANRLIDFLITGGVASLDAERHERIGRMLRSVMATADDEDCYGQALPASAQQTHRNAHNGTECAKMNPST